MSLAGPRSLWVLGLLLSLAGLICAGFVALGSWQIQRLAWKEGLIARIQQTQLAEPVAVPASLTWPSLDSAALAYQRVQLRGRFAHERETLVRASTELGTGFWVLTPLALEQGGWVLVNRGYVGPEQRSPGTRPASAAPQTVVGLLRPSEPGGSALQKNAPGQARWYSRDVQAIAAARGLGAEVAPFFIDAVAGPDPAAWPRAGLTVLQFKNNHRVYAITWFTLALMVFAGAAYLLRTEWQLHHDH